MAEFGSHHSSVTATQPSLFEVLAEENLAFSLRSAFRHLFKILGENFPDRLGYFHKYFEELYTVVDFVFQYIHMRAYGSTFPEHFYGLKRIPDPRQLNVSEKRLLYSLVMSIVFPYLQLQLEILFKKLRGKDAEGALQWNKGISEKIGLMYLRAYPSVHFLWEMTGLCYYMAYAVYKTKYHSPLLHLCGMHLVTSTDDELINNLWEEVMTKKHSLSVVWKLAKTCVSTVTIGISVGAFFLQFLEWWYSREGGKTTFSTLPIPPPPSQWPTHLPPDICPLCQKTRKNATALACSGFVFCYPCVFQYVKKNRRCPVTGYPASLNQLIRIYHMD